MSFDLRQILESKRALRRKHAALPVAEKMRMLDTLRERSLAIRPVQHTPDAAMLREEPPRYRAK